jgi:ATP-dependent DNA helicase RecG
VCPLIEESEKLQLQTAQDTYATLAEQLPDLRIGLVHGRLKPDEKQAVMAAFQAHEIDLLVATTVIEVGVDVPNAALMVIEHAERMGLAQLHQLRGRVGRGSRESVCVLLYEGPLSELARARLKVIFELTDGFEIARQDLLLRGPGELLGHRQRACQCCALPIWNATWRCWKRRATMPGAASGNIPTSRRATSSAGWAAARACHRPD